MKIVVDENIANAEEVFSCLGEVILMHGREITNEILKDSDAIVVRSITNVNEKLLQGTKVKFVGTATIGRDHIDTNYLVSNKIAFSDAKGCNAEAVKEYVFTALTEAVKSRNIKFKDVSIGIIGAGNIGSRVAKSAEALGIKTILNDPPLKRQTDSNIYKELDEAMQADIITLHVPLNREGIDKTVHLFDYERLNRLKDNTVIINSSRGSVIDNEALGKLIPGKNFTVVLDVWENEPDINQPLLEKVFLGTPHIAGYSYEGKINGTMMIYSALCKFLNKEDEYRVKSPEVENPFIEVNNPGSREEVLQEIFSRIYDIKKDDEDLRKILLGENLRGLNAGNNPLTLKVSAGKHFDMLRKNYPLRREFSNYTAAVDEKDIELRRILSAFRFNIMDSL
jgi:erythronate-4-phosphate dehydrogenase